MKVYTLQINDEMTNEEIISYVNETKAMFDRVIESNPPNLNGATIKERGLKIVEKNEDGQLEFNLESLSEGKN